MVDQASTHRRLLHAAMAATQRGWPVLPLRPYSKYPAIRDWPNRASTAAGQVARWWSAGPWNIGIACGPAGLLVIDLDAAHPGDPPPDGWAGRGVPSGTDVLAALAADAGRPVPSGTYTVATPSGQHLYFAAPPGIRLGNTAGRLGTRIDTRGHGGFVVAAGSVLRTRGRLTTYRIVREVPPAPLPDWIAAALAGSHDRIAAGGMTPAVAAGRVRAYADAALAGEAHTVRSAGVGTRNHTLFRAAANLGEFVGAGLLDQNVVTSTLLAAAAVHIGIDASPRPRPAARSPTAWPAGGATPARSPVSSNARPTVRLGRRESPPVQRRPRRWITPTVRRREWNGNRIHRPGWHSPGTGLPACDSPGWTARRSAHHGRGQRR